MSTAVAATIPKGSLEDRAEPRPRLWRVGVASGAVAAVATCLTVVVARAGGVAVAIQGEEIPLVGFAELTMVGALIGVALAKTFARRARRSHTAFVRTMVALTALSIVPDVLVDATVGTTIVLALTHVIAAAIIVPVLAARLAD